MFAPDVDRHLSKLEAAFEALDFEYSNHDGSGRSPQLIAIDADTVRVEVLGLQMGLDLDSILAQGNDQKTVESRYIQYLINAAAALQRACEQDIAGPAPGFFEKWKTASRDYYQAKEMAGRPRPKNGGSYFGDASAKAAKGGCASGLLLLLMLPASLILARLL